MNISFITLNRFVEERIESDMEYRQLFERTNRSLLSHGRALSDEALLDKLHTIGFPLDKPQFLALSQRFVSAEEMAYFVYREKPKIPDSDHDWIWIAFVCLWERWQPERLSLEMIDDRMQDGYKIQKRYNAIDTCRLWIAVWEGIWHLIESQHIRSVKEFEDRFHLTQFLSNWIQDFVSELYTAGFKDTSFHEKRLNVIETFLTRLQPDGLLQRNFQSDQAQTYFLVGMPEKGEELFRQWLHNTPNWGWGWIHWADCYSLRTRDDEKDPAKAEKILKQGLAIPGVEEREYLLERLAEIYSDTGRAEEAQALQSEIDKLSKATKVTTASRVVIPNNSFPPELKSPGIRFGKPVESLLGHRNASSVARVGRNDLCRCGSGKKFKRCCGKNAS